MAGTIVPRIETMTRIIRTLVAAAALAVATLLAPAPGEAADQLQSLAEVEGRVVNLGLNKSMVIDTDEDVKDVLVSSPGVADAVVRSSRRVFLIGVAPGEANVFLFGEGGRQLAQFELVVSRDMIGLQELMSQTLPRSNIVTKSIGGSLVLTGTAPSAETAAKAADLAAKFMGGEENVVNMLSIAGSDQVHLKVVVAEVQREVLKQLGVNTQAILESTVIELALDSVDIANNVLFAGSLADLVKLLEEQTAIRTLAEPTLTAISGEQANFLAGGEYPIPVSDSNGEVTVEYKKFGIQLAFRPVVVSPGRISLQIMTEVSDLTDAGAVEINGLRIPALAVRRAESTVELPSGGSIVLAGLIKDNVRQTVSGFPFLMDLPILGSIFRSREYQRNQTELAIFVSPYLVDPVATGSLTRPDKNLNFANDAAAIFLNQVNKVYGNGSASTGAYQGRVGFVYE
jgi:pilus assembly protein CpaC